MRHIMIRVLALACVLALLCAGCAEKENAGGDGDEVDVPWITNQDPTPAATDGTDTPKDPEPDAQPEEPDYAEAYAAYLKVLTENREGILGYDWQKGMVTDQETYQTVPYGPTEAVALVDVWGDDAPELLYLTAVDYEGFRYAARLHVCTWDGSAARELYDGENDPLDGQVGGGMGYRLFQLAGEKNLWIFADYYSEGDTQIYTKLAAEGEMKPLLTCQHDSFPEETAGGEWEVAHTWTLDGKESTQSKVSALIPAEESQEKGLIMRNLDYYEYSGDPDITVPTDRYHFSESAQAVTCDAAIERLRAALGEAGDGKVDEKAFFASLPRDFSFLSGAGGWSSDLVLSADGSFVGVYHDSDMGDMGEGYPNGTVYLCKFSGRFGNVTRIDEYTYSMHLLELTPEAMEESWIEDGVRYVASVPYGLENADEVMVYLPGSWTISLPAGFLSWVSMPNAWSEKPVLLPFCGLYNVNDAEGWSSAAEG